MADAEGRLRPELVSRLRAAGCVFAEAEAAQLMAAFPAGAEREAAVRRRESGTPLEHVLGSAVFAGIRVIVHPGVFVPRRRAEPLVDLCVDAVRSVPGPPPRLQGGRRACVVDLGCGSGAIAAAVSARLPDSTVLAVDVDPLAVACARRNGADHGFEVHRGDWFAALPRGYARRVDVGVAYLPHVPSASLDSLRPDHRAAEPLSAVLGGVDGLDPLRAVLAQAPRWLGAAGVLVTMAARRQHRDVLALAAAEGWTARARAREDDVFFELSLTPR